MTTMFEQICQGQSKAEALRAAQLALLESLRQEGDRQPHPLRWAAFTVTSQGR
jgi:CHAT domain-containing protein